MSRAVSLAAVVMGAAFGVASMSGCTGMGGSESSETRPELVDEIGGGVGYELAARPNENWDVTYSDVPSADGDGLVEAVSQVPSSSRIGDDLTQVLNPDAAGASDGADPVSSAAGDDAIDIAPPIGAEDDSASADEVSPSTDTPEPATWILLAATAGAGALLKRRTS